MKFLQKKKKWNENFQTSSKIEGTKVYFNLKRNYFEYYDQHYLCAIHNLNLSFSHMNYEFYQIVSIVLNNYLSIMNCYKFLFQ